MTRQVMITRHPRDCAELTELLRPAGIAVAPYPVLRVEDVDDDDGWHRVLELLHGEPPRRPRWLVLASPRAAQRLVDQSHERSAESVLRLPAAVVGEGTAAAAAEAGLEVRIVGPGTGAELAKALIAEAADRSTIIFACGRHRRDELPEALAEAGHLVLSLVLYHMRRTPPRELPPIPERLEAVVLTSPRAARFYLEGVGGLPLACTHWALGPTTREAAAELGIDCRIPAKPSLASLAEELCQSS